MIILTSTERIDENGYAKLQNVVYQSLFVALME